MSCFGWLLSVDAARCITPVPPPSFVTSFDDVAHPPWASVSDDANSCPADAMRWSGCRHPPSSVSIPAHGDGLFASLPSSSSSLSPALTVAAAEIGGGSNDQWPLVSDCILVVDSRRRATKKNVWFLHFTALLWVGLVLSGKKYYTPGDLYCAHVGTGLWMSLCLSIHFGIFIW